MAVKGGPHTRDLTGTQIVDYEERVDIPRLKRERLARLRAEMARADLAGVLLYDSLNIRYATGTRDSGVYGMRFFHRYALVPQQGKVILYGSITDNVASSEDLEVRSSIIWDYFPCGRNVEAAAKRWAADLAGAIKELGIAGGRLGLDRLDFVATEALRAQNTVTFADARVPV